MDVETSSTETQSDRNESENHQLHTNDNDYKAESLEIPIKSIADRREFRNIRLSNGLTALLISLPDDYKDLDDGDNDDDEYDSMDDEEEEDPSAKRAREQFRKENKASCGLCINVGEFSDPENMPRMARILATTVSEGSRKYPQDTMKKYAKKCGALFTDHVDSDQTLFSIYRIPESRLRETLDRLACCFIDPLMSCDSIRKIRNKRCTLGLFELFRYFGHPVLKWGPENRDISDEVTDQQLREELIKFRERHYSAHRMALSIEAKLPLDTLENYAKEFFSKIPSNDLPPDDLKELIDFDPFDRPAFRRIYKVKIISIGNVELSWIIPPQLQHYKSKPFKYSAWILRHKGESSLYRYLEKKEWCENIDATVGNRYLGANSLYALFKLRLNLTKKGLENMKKVLDAVYSYINMMRAEEPRKQIFDEMQKIQEKKFTLYAPDKDVTTLCEKMQWYPPVDYMTGDDLCCVYDPNAIKECLNALRADNANITIFDKPSYNEISEDYELWLQREGAGTEISEDWIRDWKTAEPMPEFKLPQPNIFVADEFVIIPIPVNANRYPVKIHEDSYSEVWYKADRNLGFQKSYMKVQYVSPLPSASSKNMAMQDVFVSILRKSLSDRLKTATDEAELNFEVHDNYKGLYFEVSGFHQKLPLLLETLATHIAGASKFVTEDLFRADKEQLLRRYSGAFLDPEELSQIVARSIKNVINWTPVELYEALWDVEFHEFRNFVERLIHPIFIRSFVQGNVTEIDAIRSVKRCFELSNCQSASASDIPMLSEVVIPRGVRCCRVKSFDPHNYQSNVTNYYQFDIPSPNLEVMISVVIMILKHDLWNTVYGIQIMRGISLYYYGINGSRAAAKGYFITGLAGDEDDVVIVDNRIESFRKYFNKTFREMAANDLLGIKEDLIKFRAKEFPVVGSKENAAANWNEILWETYIFDREERALDVLKKITIEEFRLWMMTLSADVSASDTRKISAQVVGFDEVWEESPDHIRAARRLKSDLSNAHTLRYSLEYLTRITVEQQLRDNDYYINNIESYKRGLSTMPLYRCRV